METYPIRIYGRETGKLQVCQEGMYTVFRAVSECSGEMIRLCVFGGGKSGYLGVMVPDGNGGATLTRRLSKSAMCNFPEVNAGALRGRMHALPGDLLPFAPAARGAAQGAGTHTPAQAGAARAPGGDGAGLPGDLHPAPGDPTDCGG